MTSKPFVRLCILALVWVVIVAGCATPTGRVAASLASPQPSANSTATGAPTASPSAAGTAPAASPNPADQAAYSQIEQQVQGLRTLKPTSSVTPVLLDSAGVASYLTRINAAETNHVAMANESRLLIHMGMLRPGASLEQLELDLESGQVIGFYDPKSKGLYVLSQSGGVGGVQKITFAHEYTHALQDQNFGLDKLETDVVDQGDRDLARISLPEGDATLAMTQWALKFMSPAELMQVANDPSSADQLKQLGDAPPILRETLTFPYTQGQAFVQRIYSSGGWAAVDKLYADPPDSTTQIIHPEQYINRLRPIPLFVPPAPARLSGWKLTMEDTLGEFQLGIWLAGYTGRNAGASAAVAHWAGDRVGFYEGPDGGWAIVLNSIWRTQQGANDFHAAATTLLGQMGVAYRVCSTAQSLNLHPQSEEVVLASDASAVDVLAPCPA